MNAPMVAMTFAALSLLAGAATRAQSANRTPEEQRNLDIVLDFYNNVITPLKIERFKDYVAPTFIEHFPGIDGNLESLKKFFEPIKKAHPNGLPPSPPVLAMVDGDLVTLIVVRKKVTDPKDRSKSHQLLGFETFRLKDGKQVEHWEEHMALPPAHEQNKAKSAPTPTER